MAARSHSKTTQFTLYWLPVILYCLVIFIQSSFPSTDTFSYFPYSDKMIHTCVFAVLGFLFYRAMRTTGMKENMMMLVILSVFLSSMYGLSDEIHQCFVPSRTAEVSDFLADALGSVIGAMAGYFCFLEL